MICFEIWFLFSTTAVRRMALIVAPTLCNALNATPAASLAWMGLLAPGSHFHPQSHLHRPNPGKPQWGVPATAPPAPRTTHPSSSVPLMRCATEASASLPCPRTTRTRRWPCRCPPCTDPCWGKIRGAKHRISTQTLEPSAQTCDIAARSAERKAVLRSCMDALLW